MIDCALSQKSGHVLPKKKTTETLAFIFVPTDLSLSLRLLIQQLLARAICLLVFSTFSVRGVVLFFPHSDPEPTCAD